MTSSYVYFIQLINQDMYIKIGTTTNPHARLDSLRTSTPYNITLLGLMKGERQEEHELHQKFESYRATREWFYPSPAIVDFVKQQATVSLKSLCLSEAISKPSLLTHRERVEIDKIYAWIKNYDPTEAVSRLAKLADPMTPEHSINIGHSENHDI